MSYDKLKSLPVYRKSLELCYISREIASYVTFNKDLLKLYQSNSLRDIIADSLLTDAILIPKKIALAEQLGTHTERQKSAAYINIMIRNIMSYCNGLEKDGVKEKEYLNLLRKEVKLFRKSFKSWRSSFKDGNNLNRN
ncbi:MAG: hypothetical protein CML04_08465 [Pseudozobellia sp.]|nr:hypothetical protein [Pseudozobellia sp.]MBG48670.1 hypothetical protein [Pseudozobellia sp.]MBG50705.1 hypothetical protein [Pseudozobellia sp.]|tara:strand:- start:6198 stop:6611 length:414 start_codon:yes stop_codon:yes gene_type:complete